MAPMGQIIRELMAERAIKCEKVSRYSVTADISGRSGKWRWMFLWNKTESMILSLNFLPVIVPQERRTEMCRFMAKANADITFGNFQMDSSDGWACFRTGMPILNSRQKRRAIAAVVIDGLCTMGKYLPTLMSLAKGFEPVDQRPRHERSKSKAAMRRQRVTQFREYLLLMKKRAHEEVGGACFLTFSAEVPEDQVPEGLESRMVQFIFEEKWFALGRPQHEHIAPGGRTYPQGTLRVLPRSRHATGQRQRDQGPSGVRPPRPKVHLRR
ncbi:MAG: hypothetical protein ABFD92_07905 [Planctomycetaceae bacterium]|nr:YbjN domain-containing protein [Planctomycetaceae bacterium]